MHYLSFLLSLASAALTVTATGQHDDTSVLSTDEWPFIESDLMVPLSKNADTPDLFKMPKCGEFVLEEATIDQMQAVMKNGTLSSVQLSMCYLQRTYQTQGYLNSIIQINPDFLSIAKQMDDERAVGKVRGPLHGIPFVVKDNFATKDSMETTAGSYTLLGSIVPRDSFAVAKLRDAGAVLFGKSGLSEWADMRSNYYSEGYSARGGQVRSAYNLTVNPGGSSSGSGVAVGANVVAFALGTETDGSVINPAMRNGVVGFKPTVGRTSRAGVIPESEHQDSVGTFGRTVTDAIYAFDAIWGVDERDNYTEAQTKFMPGDGGYAQYLSKKDALKGAVFGVPWNSFWVYTTAEQKQVLKRLLCLMESAGATIINSTEILDYKKIISPDGWDWDYGTTRGYANESEFTVVKVDFYNNIKTYLSEVTNTNMHSLEDIVQYNIDYVGTEGGLPNIHPAFPSGQDAFLASLATKGEKNETYWQALNFVQSTSRNGINYALGLYKDSNSYRNSTKLNGLLVPPDVGQSYQIAAQAGYPAVTIPVSTKQVSGMPFSLGILQTAWREDELIKYASAIEDLQLTTKGWPYKRTLPTFRGYLERNIPVPFQDE